MSMPFDLAAMGATPMAPTTERLRRLLSILEPHPTVEEFAGHVVRDVTPESLETIRLLLKSVMTELKLIAALVALECTEQAITNPNKED